MIRLFKLLILLLIIPLHSSAQQTQGLQRFEYTHKSMGSLFRIICYSNEEESARQASKKAFTRVDELNYIMSDYLPDSELNRLSRQSGSGNYVEVSTDLYEIIKLSYQWSVQTDGIFDISVGTYSQLWRRAGRKDVLPTSDLILIAAESVGYKYILIDSVQQRVLLEKPKMQLDLGGIAKGFAVDEMYDIFAGSGIDRVLIDGGGDIRVGDPPPGKDGWNIILENSEYDINEIQISKSSIATSGDLYRFVQIDSIKYSHIIDPRTGYGVTTPRTVTVQAGSCTEADVLASVLSIWGPGDGFLFLSSVPDVKAIILQDIDGKIKRFEKGKFDYIK